MKQIWMEAQCMFIDHCCKPDLIITSVSWTAIVYR